MSKKIVYTLGASSVVATLVEKLDDATTELESITFEVSDVPAELSDGENPTKSLVAYGLSKFLQDRTSSVDAEGKLEAMGEVFELLKCGEWRQRREGAGVKKAAIDPIFAQAIAEIKGCSVAAATMALQAQDAESRKALRQVEAVKAKIDEIRVAATSEAENLLDGMV